MVEILFVGAGGFVGAIARYLIAGLLQSVWAGAFPVGTLVVNVAGCVAIGGLSEWLEAEPFLSGETRAFLVIGLLGGFTTFSAFGNETVNLLRHVGTASAGANVAANVLLAVGGVWLGRTVAQLMA